MTSAPTPTKPVLLGVNQLALLKAPWPDVSTWLRPGMHL